MRGEGGGEGDTQIHLPLLFFSGHTLAACGIDPLAFIYGSFCPTFRFFDLLDLDINTVKIYSVGSGYTFFEWTPAS